MAKVAIGCAGPRGRMKESRQHPRLSIAVDVDVATGSNFYAGRIRDLSLGGLFVETDVALPIGIPIEVKLKLPKATFTLSCEVVWLLSDRAQRTVGVGVRFVELPPAAKLEIEAFMAIRTPVDFETPEADDEVPGGGPPPLPASKLTSPQDLGDAARRLPTPKVGLASARRSPPRPTPRGK